MILDLHSHSIKSDDGRAKVDNYCQWIRKRNVGIDGFVLTEHRQFDDESDYRPLEDEFGVLILKASEVETEYGHVLVFGVNPDIENAFDFTNVRLSLARVLAETERHGGIAVPKSRSWIWGPFLAASLGPRKGWPRSCALRARIMASCSCAIMASPKS